MRPLKDWFSDRCQVFARITVCLILDALIFFVWILIAWGADSVSIYMSSKGVHEYFALAFKWVSSLGTLTLTTIYIASDIIGAVKDCINENK